MKLRLSDRLLTALVAVICLVLSAALVAESVFGVHISQWYTALMSGSGTKYVVVRAALVAFCLIMAILCLRVSCRRQADAGSEFVEQSTDNGPLRVSVKAIEGLVWKCVANHNEMVLHSVQMMNRKDGLSVQLTISTASDISIPLAVTTLQRQLREYVMESTGVDLRDIHVDVDDAQADLSAGTYRLHHSVIDPEEEKRAVPEAADAADEPLADAITMPVPEQTASEAEEAEAPAVEEASADAPVLTFPEDDDTEVTVKPDPGYTPLSAPEAEEDDRKDPVRRLDNLFYKN